MKTITSKRTSTIDPRYDTDEVKIPYWINFNITTQKTYITSQNNFFLNDTQKIDVEKNLLNLTEEPLYFDRNNSIKINNTNIINNNVTLVVDADITQKVSKTTLILVSILGVFIFSIIIGILYKIYKETRRYSQISVIELLDL